MREHGLAGEIAVATSFYHEKGRAATGEPGSC